MNRKDTQRKKYQRCFGEKDAGKEKTKHKIFVFPLRDHHKKAQKNE